MKRIKENYTLRFKYGTSKAADSYGMIVASLYVNDKLASRCHGMGYDMTGTCLANWIEKSFFDKLSKIRGEFYGLTWSAPVNPSVPFSKVRTRKDTKPRLDGGCGENCMWKILKAIGGEYHFIHGSKNETIYVVSI